MKQGTTPRYPARLQVGTAQFERRADFYAVRDAAPGGAKNTVAVMRDDAYATFAVYQGRPRRGAAAKTARPVYSAGPEGPLAVPTGLVFVRLKENVRPGARRAQFAKAGFRIDRTLAYAPNAALLRASRGGVESALAGLEALRKVADVEHVEPQVLLERALK
jgi:hypothetical protein